MKFIKDFKEKRSMIKDLIKRREEVLHRTGIIANRKVPDFLLDAGFTTILKWIIMPHIVKSYEHYNSTDDSDERGAVRSVYNILKEVEQEAIENE